MSNENANYMSRRSFITAASAAAVIGAATSATVTTAFADESNASDYLTLDEINNKKWSFEIAPDPIDENEIDEEREADLIVVGAGTSGICTAISAAQSGISVIIFAKGSGPVGRGGSILAVNSRYMEEQGIDPISPELLRYQMKITSYDVDLNKWFQWYRNSEEAMNWFIDLTEQTDLEFLMERGNNGEMFGDPSYCPLGTHTWQAQDATNCADGQPETVAALMELAINLGIRVYYNTTACYLERQDSGRVTSVIAEDEDGKYIRFIGDKAIVLATGDFSANREMMYRYAPQGAAFFSNYDSDIDPENGKVYGGLYQGDGQKMGLWIGAAWQKGFPNAVMAGAFGAEGSHLAYNIPTGFVCDMSGHRFTCELATTGIMSRTLAHLNGQAFCHIWDTDYAVNAGDWCLQKTYYKEALPTPEEMIESWNNSVELGSILKADTLEELLDEMGLPVEETMAEIDKYNGYCETGEDLDFFKPSSQLAHIKTGPFYGSTCHSILALSVLGGLRTNLHMQVCDAEDQAIPGLYNVGTMVGDVFGGCYSFEFAGHNLGMNCVTFGYLTGKYIAENE